MKDRSPPAQELSAVPTPADETANWPPTRPANSTPQMLADANTATVTISPTPDQAWERSESDRIRPQQPSATGIPGYEILGELGRGGMGVVYKARHLKLNRQVALKMILAGSHAGEVELARFQVEAEAIARLQHPNIVQVYEVGEHDGKPFFSLEFCGGGSLAHRLGGTPLPARDAATLVETLARAMQAAHDQHIIHRDLKPANVLLTEAGVPKITDFGLAKKLDEASQTQSGAIMGTPSYMAPEQAEGESGGAGPLADVYTLGAILYECLTGRPPFKAATTLETIMQVKTDEPVPPRQLQSRTPKDLETICLKCLRKEPARRYASAADLADDLRRFQAGEPIQARRVGRVEKSWRWCLRNPNLAASAGLAVVALLALVVGGIWYFHQEAERARSETLRTLEETRLKNEAERKRTEAEEEIEKLLRRVQIERGELAAQLKKSGGVFQLLDRPENWEAQIKLSRAVVGRARALLTGTEDVAPVIAEKIDEVDRLLQQDDDDRKLAVDLEDVLLELYSTAATGELNVARDVKTLKRYPLLFDRAGLNVLKDKTAVARIAASPIKEQLVAALDNWGVYSIARALQFNEGTLLLEASLQAAPDPEWGDQLRTPLLWLDSAGITKLLKRTPAAGPSPHVYVLVKFLPLDNAVKVQWLRDGQARYSKDFWINYSLARMLEDSDLAEAAGFYRVALTIRENGIPAHLSLASVLSKQNKRNEAIAVLTKAIEFNPRNSDIRNDLGFALEHQKKFPEAIAAYTKAVEIDPSNALAYNNLGNALAALGKVSEAVAAFVRARDLDPKFAHRQRDLGDRMMLQNKLSEAVAAFNMAVKIDPADSQAYHSLGNALLRQSNDAEAIAAFEKAVQLDPKLVSAQHNVGVGFFRLKKYPEAMIAFKKAIGISPNNAPAYFFLGSCHLEQDNVPEALAACTRAREIQPTYANGFRMVGDYYMQKKMLPEAVAALNKAVEIDPKDPVAYDKLGFALYGQSKYSEGMAVFEKVVELKAGNAAAAQYMVAVGFARQKKYPEAVLAYEKSLEIQPKYAAAEINLLLTLRDWIRLDPNSIEAHGKLAAALLAQQKPTEAAQAYFDLGRAFHNQSKPPEALAAFEKSVELAADKVQGHYFVGDFLTRAGEFTRGLTFLRRGQGLAGKKPSSAFPFAERIRECARLEALERRFPQVLAEKEPASPVELLEMADMCQFYNGRYFAAAELYQRAFKAEASLAEDWSKQHRYHATCAAVLAAAGKGKDVDKLGDGDKNKLRRKALEWLQADLSLARTQSQSGNVQEVLLLTDKLPNWQRDLALVSVRAASEWARLPKEEQGPWRQLWNDVAQLLNESRARFVESKHQGSLTAKQAEQVHELKMSAGKTYVIDIQSKQFNFSVRLENAQGKVLSKNENIGPKNSRMIISCKETGVFRIVAASLPEQGGGAYLLTIREFAGRKK